MIQDDDDKIVSSITEHVDRLQKDIFTTCKDIVQSIYTKAFKYKKVQKTIIAYFFIGDTVDDYIKDTTIPDNLFVTLSIPNEYHLDIKHKNCYKIQTEITEKLYLKILDKVTKLLPSTEHDLHSCKIDRVELLDK